MTEQVILELYDLSYSWRPGATAILRDVSFDLKTAQTLAITGRADAAKPPYSASLQVCYPLLLERYALFSPGNAGHV